MSSDIGNYMSNNMTSNYRAVATKLRTVAVAAMLLLLAACANNPESTPAAAEESNPLLDITRYDPDAGQRCIQIAQIRSSKIIDSQTIEFRMTGNRTYLNVLPNKCPGLRRNQPFGYRTSQSTLCNVDLITVLDPGLRQPMGRCGLGMFYLVPETGPGPVLEDDSDVDE